MTDRDHFAAAALTGLLAQGDDGSFSEEWCVRTAYHWADAMLRFRGANTTNHDAEPAAIAVSDEDRTDKAATSHRRDRSGNTTDMSQPSAASAGYAKPPTGLVTHSPDKCAGEHCCIHNPSPHHMVTWPMRWRADAGKMERVCEHGVGHPDPDDAAYWERLGHGFRNIHGCDGCCRKPQA